MDERRCFVVSVKALCLWIIYAVLAATETRSSKDIQASPVFLKKSPSLLIQKEGELVDVFCEATGSPIPTVAWFKDDKELVSSDRVLVYRNRVQIKKLRKLDVGIYICTFKNVVGSISHQVKLVIEGVGWISSGNVYIFVRPKNTTAVKGSRVKLLCQAEGFPYNITYRWYRDGIDVQLISSLKERSQILPDGTLAINNVAKDDGGWYKCCPTTNIGTPPEANAYLNVTYLPQVLNMPSHIYLPKGMMGRINCPVESNPPLTLIRWFKENRQIDFANIRHMRVSKDGTLIIKPVILSDEGHYSCTPYSPLGQGLSSSPVQVYVRDPPYFSIPPKPIFQRQPTQSVTMPCVADGDPKPVISWKKADGMMPAPSKLLYSEGNLTIVNLGKEDHGMYECIAANVVSSVITTTLVIVELVTPHPPYNVSVVTSPYSARISWLPAYDGGFPQHYVLWFRMRGGHKTAWTTVRVVLSNVTSITIHQLHPDTTYEFMVLSRNRLGDGLFSETVAARTKNADFSPRYLPSTFSPSSALSGDYYSEQRPAKPANVTVKVTRQGLLINWIGPPNNGRFMPVDYYMIQYRTVGQWVPLTGKIAAEQTSFNWTTASRGATYHFRVLGYTQLPDSEGDGDDDYSAETFASLPSDVITVHTGDPMLEGVRVSDEAVGGVIAGLFLLGILVALLVVMVRWLQRRRRKQKALKGSHMMAVNDTDPEALVENHVDIEVISKPNIVKETPI